MRDNWRDALARFGINLDEATFSYRKEEEACVLRAFGSAVGIRPERSDYRERFAQIDEQDRTRVAFQMETAARMRDRSDKAVGLKLLHRDDAFIRRLPRLLALRGTTLGRELEQYSLTRKRLTVGGIAAEQQRKHKVIGIFLYTTDKGIVRHAAHVLADPRACSLTLISDDGAPVMYVKPDDTVISFILRPKSVFR